MTRRPVRHPQQLDHITQLAHGETTMEIHRLLRTGFVALALTLDASLPALQPSTAAACSVEGRDCQIEFTDVAVKFVGAEFRPSATGNGEDVAFEITNAGTLNVPYPNITPTAFCNYSDWQTGQFVGSDKQAPKYMGIAAGTPAAPFLVTCPGKYNLKVSSVTLQSETKGDSVAANNMAYWDVKSGGHSN
jgi:hypothetical protein